MQLSDRSALIKEKAIDLGFLLCGISKAQYLEKEAENLEHWLAQNYHGEMSYMANHFDKRVDPTVLVPGCKSVISLAYNYFNPSLQADKDAPKLSMYAYGKDYHKVVRKKLNQLFAWIKETFGDIDGRVFVDSAPILERDWAKKSGIGWIGKNTLLIHPQKGSFFFLAEIILDLDLEYDNPMSDYCGTCTRCIDACPTDAIDANGYVMDGSKCISYLTIELKDEIPAEFKGKIDNWMFGCDICQQVCPWNRFSKPHNEAEFIPKEDLLTMTKEEWQNMTQSTFNSLFEGSAVKRTKYEGLKRNISFL
ncbi:MAG: tRNA epoxyqueuosine(34) reductase QueG [Saprospiraceae bacterium]